MFPSVEVVTAFLLVSVVLAVTPGPDNLFVLNISASKGARFGVFVVLGLATGVLMHTTGIAFGLSALIAASPTALTILKIFGVVYLLYLAWLAFKSPTNTEPQSESEASVEGSAATYYVRGIVMNVVNPKVLLFFLALFPQFLAQGSAYPATQVFVLGALFAIVTIVIFGSIAMAADFVRRWLVKHPNGGRLLDRASGCVFVLLAANLVIF